MNNAKAYKYLGIANAISQLSKDNSTKVGAVIIGKTGEVRSMGYNGAPRGCKADEDARCQNRPEKYWWVAHAELNAIVNASRVGTPIEGSSLVVTHFPCMECAKAIVQAGIKRVFCPSPDPVFAERWAEHMQRSEELFQECDVEVVLL